MRQLVALGDCHPLQWRNRPRFSRGSQRRQRFDFQRTFRVNARAPKLASQLLPPRWFDKLRGFGITVGMTSTKIVSVKLPVKLFRAIPGAHKGRSSFIISAVEEKLSRQRESQWKPTTARGRRLAALLEKGRAEREPLLDAEGIARELAERRGRFH